MLSRDFLVDHLENNHPSFLIIPFGKEDISKNALLNRKYNFDLKAKLQERFPNKFITITTGARKSLDLILNHYRDKVKRPLKVDIKTTSDNFYISSCVTSTIEKSDKWHREVSLDFDLCLRNHEFGYMDNRILNSKLCLENVIEDCAFAFNSNYNTGVKAGSIAPYSIFSFSKFFPIQFGGFLVSDDPIENDEDPTFLAYVENVVGYYFDRIEEWSEARTKIRDYYNSIFKECGCSSFFPSTKNDIPGVFLFNLPEGVNPIILKKYYWERGVQCSVFYGKQAFFLPLHQFTNRLQVEYFAEIFKSFLKRYE